MNKILHAVSIFTGAGGLDIGFEQAGFRTDSALELVPQYCETIKKNKAKKIPVGRSTYFRGTRILNADIRETSGGDLWKKKGVPDCLIGGPPCQSFSSAGKQNTIFDERGQLVYEYLRIIKELNPKTFLFENVRGLVTSRGVNAQPGEILLDLLHHFKEIGYNTRVQLLNAADYGAYQRRVRCFIIGSRLAAAPLFPATTHAKTPVVSLFPEEERLPWNTLGDFLNLYADNDQNHWTRPTKTAQALLQNVPSGSGLKSQGRSENTRPGGHWGYRQGMFIADLDLPARTVTGTASQDWIRLGDDSLRRLTKAEVALLQGFPPEWEFCGSEADQFQQIGNAVPSVFGRVIAETLKEYLVSGYKKAPVDNPVELPQDILQSIRYTIFDYERNGNCRVKQYPKSKRK